MGQEEDGHRAHVIGWVRIYISPCTGYRFDERDGIQVLARHFVILCHQSNEEEREEG